MYEQKDGFYTVIDGQAINYIIMVDSPFTSKGTLAELKMNQLPNLQAIINITSKSSDIHGNRIFKLSY